AQLDTQAAIDRFASGERVGLIGAPPREVVAAFAPAFARELGERRDDGAVLLLLVDAPQRQLPAHLGLDVTVMAAGAHRVNVQRATRAGGEARSVQEDA